MLSCIRMVTTSILCGCAVALDNFTPYSHQYTLEFQSARVPEQHDAFKDSGGVIALATNGIPFMHAHHAKGSNGLMVERSPDHEFDNCGGHGDTDGHYHYHFAPSCLLKALGSVTPLVDTWWHGQNTARHWPKVGKMVRVGTTLDGAPLYNPYHPIDGKLLLSPPHDSSKRLDKCHGMQMPNGEYAYFLTATRPFLPPCLLHRPGTLHGFEGKGSACKESGTKTALGCPDHIWYHGTTRDTSMLARRLTCGATACSATACGASACGATACGACGATACGATACGTTACGATACGATACGATACGASACGATACGATSSSLNGMDNNWEVTVTGKEDADGCLRVQSVAFAGDAMTNIAAAPTVSATAGWAAGANNYNSSSVTKPTIAGCTFNTVTAQSVTRTGFVLDGLCYGNFVLKQETNNGAPGLSPDKVHVKTALPQHTRACLLVNFCSGTGFKLLVKDDTKSDTEYKLLSSIEAGAMGGDKVYDFLLTTEKKPYTMATTSATVRAELAVVSMAVAAAAFAGLRA